MANSASDYQRRELKQAATSRKFYCEHWNEGHCQTRC